AEVVDELRIDGGIDDRQSLQQMGVDSLMSVNLANRLEARLGVRVPVATIVRGPSLADLADLLMSDVAPASTLRGEAIAKSERDPTSELGSRSVTRADSWLVFPRPNDGALVRLFCFNFAGGGAAPFRAWAESLGPWIELVAV